MRAEIERWLNEVVIGKYYIRNQLVYVKGNVNVVTPTVRIPCQFEHVTGVFQIDHVGLETLEGCPKIVGGTFSCETNNLKTLEGGPRFVGNDYWCRRNNLVTLEGVARVVNGTLFCGYNKITSLKGAKTVNGDLKCHHNLFDKEPNDSFIKIAGYVEWKSD